jgi:hypothetical protein
MVGNCLEADLSDFARRRPYVRSEESEKSGWPPTPPPVRFDTVSEQGTSFAAAYRRHTRKVGAEGDWARDVKNSQPQPAPFDEPTLAIIGMWTLGAGANPHFAVALGEIMLRVGQRYIAWCAYERAVLTAEAFLPDANVRGRFVAHCRARQALIEQSLPAGEVAALRDRFNAELKHGQDYQARYQQYEAGHIAAGVALDDPTFYDAFHAQHGKINSPLGEADLFITEDKPVAKGLKTRVASAVFGAGLFALTAVLVLWWRVRRAG